MGGLLVIFGAGASYDSKPFSGNPQDFEKKLMSDVDRPPLTGSIFETKYLDAFASGPTGYSNIRSLASRLQGITLNGIDFEKILTHRYEVLKNGAAPMRLRKSIVQELVDSIYYLQHLFVNSSRNFVRHVSNYHSLLTRIYDHYDSPTFVTFNYDCLLENALRDLFGSCFGSLDSYLNDHYSVIKLHGSCNWGYCLPRESHIEMEREAEYHSLALGIMNKIGYKAVLELLNGLTESTLKAERIDRLVFGKDNIDIFPAIALPLNGSGDHFEKHFICPEVHLEKLRFELSRVQRILIVGWSANEDHFGRLLMKNCNGSGVKVIIVGKDGVDEVAANMNKYLRGAHFIKYNEGFSSYLKENGCLEADIT